MSAPLPLGPFRGFAPFDEAAADVFFGRTAETEALVERVMGHGGRVVAVTGESGVGKTSLVRAGLATALGKREIPVLYLAQPDDLDGEVLRAATRAGGGPPAPGEATADYVARLARESRSGLVIVFDHLEEVLSDDAAPGRAAALGALAARVVEGAGGRVRLVLVVDSTAFARLDALGLPNAFRPGPGTWYTVERLDQAAVADVLDRTAIHAGTFFEAGLPAIIAGDLCGDRRCLPLDLQLCARAMVDFRITSIRKYQSSGGVATLRAMFFEHAVGDAAPAVAQGARRVLLDVAGRNATTHDQIESRTHLPHDAVVEAVQALIDRGVLRRRGTESAPSVALAHPALAPYVEAFGIEDRARTEAIRRRLRARLATGGRLTIRELVTVRRTLGAALSPAERTLFMRSLRRHAVRAAVVVGLVIALGVSFVVDSRQAYVLAFDPPHAPPDKAAIGSADAPPRASAASRVVVRVGRPRRGLVRLLPRASTAGMLIADTGFSSAGLVPAATARIAAGQAGGTLDDAQPGVVPGWLRDVVNGLRPVPRGVAKALIGDADGVTSLKHAFSEPLTRRETLDALAVIGRGRAGEDEILAAALGDAAPEIRRRGVEVAAAIDRRLGNGAHAAILRNALADKSPDIRQTVLREIETLPPGEATDVLVVALGDHDPVHRRAAEEATLALAGRNPGAAAAAAARLLESTDGSARRNGLPLLERIAGRAPAECAAVLERLVGNAKAPEEARVAALLALRKAGPPPLTLKAALTQAVGPSASPRLRAAALPLYARLIEPTAAEEIARAEMKGQPAARAAAAAVWGAVAITRPDLASRPLKGLIYDPSVEIRIEAARSFAFLKREGIPLVEKILKDPNAEVERAAIESALALAPINPYAIGTILGKAVKLVRPGVRRQIVEALGRLGETRPAAALPPLAHTLKDADVGTRVAVAVAFCGLARQNAVAASPYLRIAARDDHRDVRAAAAACVEELAAGDPRGGAKMATELAGAEEPAVRAAAAQSLGRLAVRVPAPEAALTTLFKLVDDADGAVRDAAARALAAFGESGAGGPGFAESKRGADAERALTASLVQGDVAARQLVVTAAAKNRLAGVLRQATTDSDESVRLAAVRAAGALAPPALDVVRAAVDDRSALVRAAATRILAAASGGGAKEVLPIYEAALRGGDHAARQAAIVGLGELTGAGEPAARLLGEALQQRSESIRAAAAAALGHLAERDPAAALPALERALHDPSYDVASAAVPGLALAWSRRLSPEALADILMGAETDSARRFAALEALVLRAGRGQDRTARGAVAALSRVAETGPPLARLSAQLGRAFLGTPSADLHGFLERLLGG